MQEYDFESIPLLRQRAGSQPKADYQQVIRERAAAGWEFVQAIPFEVSAQPHIDLIFTREASQ